MDPSNHIPHMGQFEITTEKIKDHEEQTEVTAKGKLNGKDVVIKTIIPTVQDPEMLKATINSVIIKADQLAKAFGLGTETKSIAVKKDILETHSLTDHVEKGSVQDVAKKFFKNCSEKETERRKILGDLANLAEPSHSSKTEERTLRKREKREAVKFDTPPDLQKTSKTQPWKSAEKNQTARSSDKVLPLNTRVTTSEHSINPESLTVQQDEFPQTESFTEVEDHQFNEKFESQSEELEALIKKFEGSKIQEIKDEINELIVLHAQIKAGANNKTDLSERLEKNMLKLYFMDAGEEASKLIEEWKPKGGAQPKVTQNFKDSIKNIRKNFQEAFALMEDENFSEKDISKLKEIKNRLKLPLEELKTVTQFLITFRNYKGTPPPVDENEILEEFEGEEYVPAESITEEPTTVEDVGMQKEEGKEEEIPMPPEWSGDSLKTPRTQTESIKRVPDTSKSSEDKASEAANLLRKAMGERRKAIEPEET